MSKVYVWQPDAHPNPPMSAFAAAQTSVQAELSIGGVDSKSSLISAPIRDSPVMLERGSSGYNGSGTKKCVQFQLENNIICEPQNIDPEISAPSPPTKLAASQNQIQAQTQGLGSSDDGSNYHSGSILITKNTSPFRPGGRGSKMLAKAIEEDVTIDTAQAVSLPQYVLCVGKTPCFAKVMRAGQDPSTVFIEPMHRSGGDPQLLVPWKGHLWLAKRNRLMPVSALLFFFYCISIVSFNFF